MANYFDQEGRQYTGLTFATDASGTLECFY